MLFFDILATFLSHTLVGVDVPGDPLQSITLFLQLFLFERKSYKKKQQAS